MKSFLPVLPLACTLTLASAAQTTSTPTDHKPRVFVGESDSWETKGGGGGNRWGFGSANAGGARPQTAEVIKTLGERCPQVTVNSRPEMSDYILKLDHEGGKSVLAKDNKVAVFVQKTGDGIFSKSTRALGSSVQDACAAITAHWATHATELAAAPLPPPSVVPLPSEAAPAAAAPAMATLQIESSVPNADIEIDGAFVGNTPSTLTVTPGQHTIAVKKKGYTEWNRTMNISGTAVHLNADLGEDRKGR
jgi:hypothetical protein